MEIVYGCGSLDWWVVGEWVDGDGAGGWQTLWVANVADDHDDEDDDDDNDDGNGSQLMLPLMLLLLLLLLLLLMLLLLLLLLPCGCCTVCFCDNDCGYSCNWLCFHSHSGTPPPCQSKGHTTTHSHIHIHCHPNGRWQTHGYGYGWSWYWSESEASVNRLGGSYQTPSIDNDGSHAPPHAVFPGLIGRHRHRHIAFTHQARLVWCTIVKYCTWPGLKVSVCFGLVLLWESLNCWPKVAGRAAAAAKKNPTQNRKTIYENSVLTIHIFSKT